MPVHLVQTRSTFFRSILVSCPGTDFTVFPQAFDEWGFKCNRFYLFAFLSYFSFFELEYHLAQCISYFSYCCPKMPEWLEKGRVFWLTVCGHNPSWIGRYGAGAQDNPSHFIRSEGAERDGCQRFPCFLLLFPFQTPNPWNNAPTFIQGASSSLPPTLFPRWFTQASNED